MSKIFSKAVMLRSAQVHVCLVLSSWKKVNRTILNILHFKFRTDGELAIKAARYAAFREAFKRVNIFNSFFPPSLVWEKGMRTSKREDRELDIIEYSL